MCCGFRRIAAVFVVLNIIACEPEDLTSRKVVVPGEGSLEGPKIELVPEFFVAGLEFEEGYDWRREPDYGYAPCSMFLQTARGRLLSFDVGYERQVATDNDMSRCIGGHVYTDFSTDSQTVIKRDGKELFRYPGREMLCGLVVKDGEIHTLGVPREGKGWTYRRNGVIMVSSEDGDILRGLYLDGNNTVFSYAVNPYGYYSTESAYFIVENGVATQVRVPDGMTLTDYLLCSGRLYMLLYKSVKSSPYLNDGESSQKLTTPSGTLLVSADFLETDGTDVYACGSCTKIHGKYKPVVWKGTAVHSVLDAGLEFKYVYPADNEVFAVCGKTGSTAKLCLYYGGKYFELEEGYEMVSRASASFVSGHYCVCLNPELPGPEPFYILDGEKFTVPVNGCLTAVGFELPELPEDDEIENEE